MSYLKFLDTLVSANKHPRTFEQGLSLAAKINRLPGYVDGPVFTLILNYVETNRFQEMSLQEFAKTI
jgi:hypothetical protein